MTDPVRLIGEKTFSSDNQSLFAQISHDFNPMHMDAIVARRLITGQQVVHGIHVLLTALEFWACDATATIVSITCTFNNPVNLNDRVRFSHQAESDGTSTLLASVDDLACARISLVHEPQSPSPHPSERQVALESEADLIDPATRTRPLNEAPEFHLGKRYALKPDTLTPSVHFPQCHRVLGRDGLGSTLALSYIVGMVCPGLHSVFSSVEINYQIPPAVDGLLLFSVAKYDPRFKLFDITVNGSIVGQIKSFQRPPVQIQPSVKVLSSHVVAAEFNGTQSLVIGGSRGLGEVIAKILAAGGGDTIITYATGCQDATAIKDEINAEGLAHCQLQKLNLSQDHFDCLDVDWNQLDAIYFFATPRIFRKKSLVFDARLFEEFCDFYATKLFELCSYIEGKLTAGRIEVYFPSTVFLDNRPKGMAEYAMAKSAAEVLSEEINRQMSKVKVTYTRLPRLSTDQTASIMNLSTDSTVDTLLPLVRALMTK